MGCRTASSTQRTRFMVMVAPNHRLGVGFILTNNWSTPSAETLTGHRSESLVSAVLSSGLFMRFEEMIETVESPECGCRSGRPVSRSRQNPAIRTVVPGDILPRAPASSLPGWNLKEAVSLIGEGIIFAPVLIIQPLSARSGSTAGAPSMRRLVVPRFRSFEYYNDSATPLVVPS